MNERIRKLRRILDLTQREFGERIGMKQNTIALIEGGRNTSDQTIMAICKEFSVNETWLRTGNGEMFLPEPQDEIRQLVKRYNLEPAIGVFIEKLVKLPPQQRKTIADFIVETALEVNRIEEEVEEEEDSIDKKVEAYRKALEQEKEAKGKSEVI